MMTEDRVESEYYTNGSLDEDEGLTLMSRQVINTYDLATGDIVKTVQKIGLTSGDGEPYLGYKPNRITREEYDAYRAQMLDSTDNMGHFGLASPTVVKRLRKESAKWVKAIKTAHAEKSNRLATKLGLTVDELFELQSLIK